ncbi:Pathogen-related protein [Actinidia chinensis var. chinensis]|uniref:Pathogen-related protein n=1 Tax=Actinidia chinensis var. chinensis TaxID=1590841 RepID=A0A2R6RNY3_ACTCC|nr:Pathogen-related protein [Actinidia chinensis var. chinensis]
MSTSSGTTQGDKYRSYLDGEEEKNTKWRFGAPPNYDVVNKLFEEGRTKTWLPGSLEEKVQNLVKSWEMELFHKASLVDFKTLDPNKYTFSLNGRKPLTLEEIATKLGGGYNPLLQTSLPKKFRGYDPDEDTAESSHKAFITTFPRGFALEVLQVYSGPPVIVYKFRHWGFMEGPFKGHAPTGEMVEFYGMAIFELDEHSKIVKVEFFYDRGELLGGLLKGASSDVSKTEMPSTSSCPFLKNTG